ncbi:hypothetical protein ACFVS2_20615 [Brevibacillus sp. NPDC058079]|uniref:hypothetical protein n=1 Tax=Brevibacillus sp. NPDC058079 TaxID=3346330 RepID=UPI0036E09072
MMHYKATNEIWSRFQEMNMLHMDVCTGEEEQSKFNDYVLLHEKELNHPLILETILENIELTVEFIKENEDYCKAVYRIVSKTNFEGSQPSFSYFFRIKRLLQIGKEHGWQEES